MIISVAYYSDDANIRNAVLASDNIRHRALNICYETPGYESLPLAEKNSYYAKIRAQLMAQK